MSSDEVYRLLDQEFEWSMTKAARNLVVHRVSFPEAASVFVDPNNLTISITL